MKKSAQAGIVHIALILGLVVLGVVGYYIFKNSADIFNGAEAASGKFSNLSANLRQENATFYFSYSDLPSPYSINVATSSNMSKKFLRNFGQGTSSPIIVSNPQSKWAPYQCGATVYWRIRTNNAISPVQMTQVNCSGGIGTTNPPGPTSSPAPSLTPTPTSTPGTGPVGTAPSTVNTTSFQGADGTWCNDYDGKSVKGSFNVGYSSQSFCQDSLGIHEDYCETGTGTSRDYYCTYSWNGSSLTNVRCEAGGYVCSPSSYIGDSCVRGACGPANPPSAIAASSIPSTKTLEGSDGTWCNDSDGNIDVFTKGTCQDARGIFTDYCNGSDNIQDYYCAGNWNGSSYTNVRCETGTHGCTSQVGIGYICSDAKCIIP